MKKQIEERIRQFVHGYQRRQGIGTKWREPLVAYSAASDNMYLELKEIIGPTHILPQDFLADARTVISYFLPFSKEVADSNKEGKNSSREWALAYVDTNELILALNNYLIKELEKAGSRAVHIPATHNFDKKSLISGWSHRHAAYIAGLGKFGLNNMLITDKGCCGRVGSLITDLEIEPDLRDDREYCLYKINGSCKKCVESCVNGALKVDGFDRHRCYEMCLHNDRLHQHLSETDVCGKCCVNLPCSLVNPLTRKK